MSQNSIGTVARVVMIFFSLIFFWYFLIALCYSGVVLVFGLEFSFFSLNILFALFIVFRMFYPKNVFR
ncbi:MAG: hypothetical protein K8R39_10460 [Arcobacteraceae bacterium]|nr:hypothetical protein [Arcobacteraceae bacterium]